MVSPAAGQGMDTTTTTGHGMAWLFAKELFGEGACASFLRSLLPSHPASRQHP